MKDRPKPLYEQIKDRIRAQIISGELKADGLAPSEAEIIQHYRVSSITARRCLNDLENEGYVRRIKGRGTYVRTLDALAMYRHVGLFYHELVSLSGSFISHAFNAIITELRETRFEPDLMSWATIRRSPAPAETLVELTRLRNIDACIVLHPVPLAWLRRLTETGQPIVSFGFAYQDPGIFAMLFDYASNIRERCKSLRELGHKRLAIFHESFEEPPPGVIVDPKAWDRKPFEVRSIEIPFMQYHLVRGTIEQLVNRADAPTLYYVYGYELALHVAQALNNCGVQVPQQASIIVCGNAPGPTRFELDKLPTTEMGQRAVQWIGEALQSQPKEREPLRFALIPSPGQTLGPAPKPKGSV